MAELYVKALVAGNHVAIPVSEVNSAVRIAAPVPVPFAGPLVAGLSALRSVVLTLIDCQYRFTGTPRTTSAGDFAVIVPVGGHQYGLLVDEVIDVVEIEPEEVSDADLLQGKWREAASGYASIENGNLIVIDPSLIVETQPA